MGKVSESVESLVSSIEDVSYRLELLGESLAVEAREVRHAGQRLRDEAVKLESEGRPFEREAAVQAAINKLGSSVEREIRYQIDTIREVQREI